jgi:hypothetical protein
VLIGLDGGLALALHLRMTGNLLLRAADEADLVLGSRYTKGGKVTEWGAWRRLISRFGDAYARSALGIGIRDLTGGFKCFRREEPGPRSPGATQEPDRAVCRPQPRRGRIPL